MDTEKNLLYAIAQRVKSLLQYHNLDLSINVSFCEDNSAQGSWEPESQTLSINRDYAKTSEWIEIETTIRHEIAHAIVSQILLKNNEHSDKGHGAMFKHACSMIGYNPTLESISETDEDIKIRSKIEKLLKLAESANEHEASLAMQRANEIALRHSINEVNCDNPIFYVEIPKTSIFKNRKKSYLIEIAKFCIRNYNIQLIWTYTYDKQHNQIRCVEIMGTRHLVEQASYAFDFLARTGMRLYNEYKRKHKDKNLRGHAKSWWSGFLAGISSDLTKAQKKLEEEGLVISADHKLIEAFKSRYPKQMKTYSKAQTNYFAKASGFQTGKETKIHKGCVTKGETGRFLPK
jgi:hypothetical protein